MSGTKCLFEMTICIDVLTTAVAELFFSSDCELWSMTLTFKNDLENIKMNQNVKYLGQRSFNSKVIV